MTGTTLILPFLLGFSFAKAPQPADPFQGLYHQSVTVRDLDHPRQVDCENAGPGHTWSDGFCVDSTGFNTVEISPVLDVRKTYFVRISTVSPEINFCDFANEMILTGSRLVFRKGQCQLSLTKDHKGLIQIQDHQCSDHVCGLNVRLTGTGQGFSKAGVGQTIRRGDEHQDDSGN